MRCDALHETPPSPPVDTQLSTEICTFAFFELSVMILLSGQVSHSVFPISDWYSLAGLPREMVSNSRRVTKKRLLEQLLSLFGSVLEMSYMGKDMHY